MRKKSHISLAGQMMRSLETDGVLNYKITFCLGNILPDCKPSFVTTPHTYDETFNKICEKMDELIRNFDPARGITMRKTLCMGEITHYIADYFTFPHNSHYTGNLKDHCVYEGDLKRELKSYITAGGADTLKDEFRIYGSVEELVEFIREIHDEYMTAERCIEDDIHYSIIACNTVTGSLLNMCCRLREEYLKNQEYVFVS